MASSGGQGDHQLQGDTDAAWVASPRTPTGAASASQAGWMGLQDWTPFCSGIRISHEFLWTYKTWIGPSLTPFCPPPPTWFLPSRNSNSPATPSLAPHAW